MNSNLFIVTGGPGSGKTTLLTELENRGFQTIPEVARKIIQEQMQQNGNALPWGKTELYKEIMFERSVNDFIRISSLNTGNIIFFDRGIIDTIGYARLAGLKITPEMDRQAKQYQYNKKVFILPFWDEIYTTDAERKQTIEEAVNTYKVLKERYEFYGYNPVEVPKIPVKNRADFILWQITETNSGICNFVKK